MIDIAALAGVLKAAGTAKEIAKFVGLIEAGNMKLDKLLQVELKAGISNLRCPPFELGGRAKNVTERRKK